VVTTLPSRTVFARRVRVHGDGTLLDGPVASTPFAASDLSDWTAPTPVPARNVLVISMRGQSWIDATTTDAGTVDAAASTDGASLYVQTGANGIVDEYHVNGDGSLTPIGSVTVANSVGGEGIVAI